MRTSRARTWGPVLAAAMAALGCPPSETDLEITEIRRTGSGPIELGSTLALEVDVHNNRGDAQTVAAAVAASVDEGLYQAGPAVEIRRNQTETLTLEVLADRPFIEGCEVAVPVFLVRPGDPPDITTDLWTDVVPENHQREHREAFARPVPTSLDFRTPIREIIDETSNNAVRHHYQADAAPAPPGSMWAVQSALVRTQNVSGGTVELLRASFSVATGLRTQGIHWALREADSRRRFDSITQAQVTVLIRDCEGFESVIEQNAVSVVRAGD